MLPFCDLIVGTEEEVLIASGESDLLAALHTIRAASPATIVLKRGAMGCIVYEGDIADDLEAGIVGQGFRIEVYNTLGAGDAFMSGFLRGWLRGEPHATSATWANACGAITVSRLLCSPEIPTFEELQYFLTQGSECTRRCARTRISITSIGRPRGRKHLSDAHGAGDRPPQAAGGCGEGAECRARSRIGAFKLLAVKAAARVAKGRPGYGMLIDDKFGRDALFAASKQPGFWIARPLEEPGSCPLRFEFTQDVGGRLIEWPLDHCIKCLCFYHPDDPQALKDEQARQAPHAL